ncbi:MAG: hypothetical protein ABEJ40_08380 [Haloarculaceae archaeon]
MSAESAVFVDDLATLRELDGEYDRVYFGNEFCDKRMPDPEAVTGVYEYCEDRGLATTLVTPIMTPTKESEMAALFEHVGSTGMDVELVFNDLGAYDLAEEVGAFDRMAAGRVLSGQKRGPAVDALSGDGGVELQEGGEPVTDQVNEHFEKSVVNVPYARDHFDEMGVDRVELDVLSHGMYDETIDFSASVYYPWTYVSVKRWCRESTSVPLCDENCPDVVQTLDNRPATPELLYRKNNVIFTYTDDVPDLNYVDREVFMPDPVN